MRLGLTTILLPKLNRAWCSPHRILSFLRRFQRRAHRTPASPTLAYFLFELECNARRTFSSLRLMNQWRAGYVYNLLCRDEVCQLFIFILCSPSIVLSA